MSFPPALIPSARNAYRAVVRSTYITFKGDPPRKAALLSAVRQTFESPSLTPPKRNTPPPLEETSCSSASSSTSASAVPGSQEPPKSSMEREVVTEDVLRSRIQEWQDVAVFLRRNVVQGVQDDTGAYKLRVTKDTELGDNASIKEPPKLPTTPFPNRARRRRKQATPEDAGTA